ncbi:uncharacterized protein FTJAE_9597 [Fusarium tjaetaba]|uniref:RNI-like protein n=1 Tax=Fusarium tjaetaba TaxID=1567544 RepID=A0A8H5VLG2_9HYPO|nr:uncharacterized protein FTJAE_9597 [Fusarium tjaetaba]KAF5626538.1 hypothetical protein FTJAE_9597 [Fusarium tjaetaba]
MFEVQHNHHGQEFKRFFHHGRSSMSAIEDKRAEEFRRHVWAVTMIDEDPLAGSGEKKNKKNRQSIDLVRPGSNKLRSKRASAYAGSPPVTKPNDKQHKNQLKLDTTATMKDSTVTVRPVHPPSFGSPKDLSSVQENAINAFLANTESPKGTQDNFSPTAYPRPTYAVLETPLADPTNVRPNAALNRPRKLSNNSVTTASSFQSRESMVSARRTPSWGSRTSMETNESTSQWRPEYQNIQLVGPDSATLKKKFKMAQGIRVLMLRRILRSNPHIAEIVRTLKVPAPEIVAKGSGAAEYEDLIATLVMACPNLESLSGLSVPYDHSFKKIFHALSTRPMLREMNWLVHASPHQRQQRIQSSTQQLGLVMPGELRPSQEAAFLAYHDNWSRLETFTVHCLPGATVTPENLLTSTLKRLPNLKHLHLCNLPPNSFDDSTLLALPPLHSLTLSHISGITSSGLSSFATQSTSLPLRKLTLRHTPLTSLAALARILSNLRNLLNFSLVQTFPPVMPENDSFALWMMPYLANNTVQSLHWDITSHATCVNAADDILARSISAGGFPALRTLRALNDPDGIFQDLCYPVERIDLPSDRFRTSEQPESSSPFAFPPSSASPMSPTRLFKSNNSPLASPRTPVSPFGDTRRPYTSLHTARLAAQTRLEAARSRPKFTVNVVDEGGAITETFSMAGFIGTAGSSIKYHLLPDRGTTDDKGGLIDVRDLDSDAGESLIGGREGCTGRWNMRDGIVADKKEKERWWHTERGRWTKVTL